MNTTIEYWNDKTNTQITNMSLIQMKKIIGKDLYRIICTKKDCYSQFYEPKTNTWEEREY
jgi:hypothetical protein